MRSIDSDLISGIVQVMIGIFTAGILVFVMYISQKKDRNNKKTNNKANVIKEELKEIEVPKKNDEEVVKVESEEKNIEKNIECTKEVKTSKKSNNNTNKKSNTKKKNTNNKSNIKNKNNK